MTYRKQKACLLIAAVLFLSLLCATALAQTYVFDDADLLTDAERADLENEIDGLRTHYQTDFAVLTTADTQGKTTELYCADYFEAHGLGQGKAGDGVLLCVDMDNRIICLVTHGGMIQVIDDDRKEAVYDTMYEHVSNGDFAAAFSAGLQQVAGYIDEGVQHGQFTYDKETGAVSSIYYEEDQAMFQHGLETGEFTYDEATGTYYYNQNYQPTLWERVKRAFTPGFLGGSAAVSAGAGFASSGGVKSSYKKKAKPQSFAFAAAHGLNLLNQSDNLVRTYTTTRRIPRDTGGGSGGGGGGFHGSGTFSSSSGGSFGGGGGRKF